MKKILLCLIFILLFSPCVYACSNSVKSKLKILASNVNFDLDYKIINNKASFDLIITGLNEELYIVDENDKVFIQKDGTIVFKNLTGGQKYKYQIHASNYGFCGFGSLLTRTINVPSYNPYYNDDLCLKYKDSDLCSRWNNLNFSYDEFKDAIARLEKEQEVIDDIIIPVDEKNIFDYVVWIVIGTVILSSFVIYVIRLRKVGF